MENFTFENFWFVCLAVWKMAPIWVPMGMLFVGCMVWERKNANRVEG